MGDGRWEIGDGNVRVLSPVAISGDGGERVGAVHQGVVGAGKRVVQIQRGIGRVHRHVGGGAGVDSVLPRQVAVGRTLVARKVCRL